MSAPKLEPDDPPPSPTPAAPDDRELTARARGWRIAGWLAVGLVVALVVYLVVRSRSSGTPAPAPTLPAA